VKACTELASVIRGFCGLTTRTLRVAVALVTVSNVEPFTLPNVALIVVEPIPTEVARPFEPVVLPMVAMFVLVELHVTDVVMFCVLESLKVPVAVNCCDAPFWIEGFAGVTAMEFRVGAAPIMVSVVAPLIDPDAA
jgi:hypothetical protein